MRSDIDWDLLMNAPLFHGITKSDAESILQCLRSSFRRYTKGEIIYRAGDRITDMGLVLRGGVRIENDDVWGNRNILDYIEAGQVFAEAYACVPEEPLMVSAAAAEETEVLFLNVQKLFTVCTNACACHNKLLFGLLSVTARKNLILSRKILHTAPKTIRGRLLAYLSFQSIRQGNRQFSIPFDRQQLADYLGVDRSALSAELGKLRQEGFLTCKKNFFCLSPVSKDFPSG